LLNFTTVVDSEPGKGSKFTFWMPLEIKNADEQESSAKGDTVMTINAMLTVLIIEDDVSGPSCFL